MIRSFQLEILRLVRRVRIDVFVVDVDGVLTDGTFLYDTEGKAYKVFGPDDSDALKLLSEHVDIVVVSADYRGFDITRARVSDMGFEVSLVPSSERLEWVVSRFDLNSLAYMGDSFEDARLLRAAALGLCPANGNKKAKKSANLVTTTGGGNRAVAEACGVIAQVNRLPMQELL